MSSPAAPMSPSETDGFTVNKRIETIIKQNFKMLLLTMPGERVMDPAFGCGLKYALFEQFGTKTYGKIKQRITSQTSKYIPPIEITNIEFDDSSSDRYQLGIKIQYKVTAIGLTDFLDLVVR
tara:strand:+ start:17884 stop:18249 length:366 start_codon:yes stop_codon:yes gene_type:complete